MAGSPEEKFATTVPLVIAAPPRTLADLRRALHADVRKRIVAEVGKDLTKHPVHEIEAHLRELA